MYEPSGVPGESANLGGCVNLLTLDITGHGARLVGRLVGRRIGDAIERENRGFKRAAEAEAAHADEPAA